MPNQHGAWAMLVVPCLMGLIWAGLEHQFRFSMVLLSVTWLLGYFTFFATTQWLKSRRKPRFRPAMLTYGAITAGCGLVLLLLEPHWWSWALVFGPLTAIGLLLVVKKRERSVASGLVTVLAACLLPMVVGSRGVLHLGGVPELVVVTLVCFGYFFGTVLYVKTIIRERGSAAWVVASVGWHAAWTVGCLWLPTPARWWVVAFFAATTVRAFLVPWLGPLKGRAVTAKQVGIGEIVASIILVGVLGAVVG